MANTIKIKQSATASSVPTTGDIVTGELAINVTDQKLYSSDGTSVFEIGASGGLDPAAAEEITGGWTFSTNETNFNEDSPIWTNGALWYMDIASGGQIFFENSLNTGALVIGGDGFGTAHGRIAGDGIVDRISFANLNFLQLEGGCNLEWYDSDDLSSLTSFVDLDTMYFDGTNSIVDVDFINLSGTLKVEGTAVSLSGHTHAASEITAGNLISTVLPYVTGEGSSNAFKLAFVNTTGVSSGNFGILIDNNSDNLTYNPTTNNLKSGLFTGSGAGLTSVPATSIATGSLANGVNQYFGASGTSAYYKVPFLTSAPNAAGNFPLQISNASLKFMYNPGTDTVYAGNYIGNGSGLTGLAAANISAGDLASGVNPYFALAGGNNNFCVPFTGATAATAGNYIPYIDSSLSFTYNPSTNTLVAGTFSGGNVTSGSDPGHTHTAYQAAGNYLLDTTDTFTGTLTVTGTAVVSPTAGAATIDIKANAGNGNAYVDFLDSSGTRVGYLGFTGDSGPMTCNSSFNVGGNLLVGGTNISSIYQAAGNYLLDTTDTFTGTLTVTGTVAATTVTGANVTSGSNPGHTHTSSSITSVTAASVASGNLGSGVLPYATATGTSSEFKVPFLNTTSSSSGNYALQLDNGASAFTYNPSSNALTISGKLTCTTFDAGWLATQTYNGTGISSGALVTDHGGTGRDVGFNLLPTFNMNVSDTLEASHCGHLTGKTNTTAYTLTGPDSTLTANVDDFPVGGVCTVANFGTSGNYTISDTASCTMYYMDGTAAPVDIVGSGTLAPGGMVTLYRYSTTAIYIFGSGFTP